MSAQKQVYYAGGPIGTVSELSSRSGIPYGVLYHRLFRLGWDAKRALAEEPSVKLYGGYSVQELADLSGMSYSAMRKRLQTMNYVEALYKPVGRVLGSTSYPRVRKRLKSLAESVAHDLGYPNPTRQQKMSISNKAINQYKKSHSISRAQLCDVTEEILVACVHQVMTTASGY